MKLLLAVVSLWAVAVFALRGESGYRFQEGNERDVEPFSSGKTYQYRLDTQISSGLAGASDQHAVTRLQADALLHFQSERLVTLRLDEIQIGSLNQEIPQPESVQPMSLFRENTLKGEESSLLELPCTFDYVDGLVEHIRFHKDDQPWSKNIKKSVLNMLQVNLKQKKQEKVQLEQLPEWQQENKVESNEQQQQTKTFVMPEITLEGECQVAYTLNKVSPNGKYSNSNSNSRWERQNSNTDSPQMFNVTKSIDFHQCGKIADIRFGPKIEKPTNQTSNLEELEERKLDRTTIIRQVLVGEQENYGIQKAKVVSHYQFKTLNVEEENPMHTIVAMELTYLRFTENRRREVESELRQVSINENEETLLYSIEWDEQEKRFYMFGDQEFPQSTPFDKVQEKVSKAENLMKKLTNMWSDKTKGIETEATIVYTRIVELLRMCSQNELNQIYSLCKSGRSRLSETEQARAEDIIIDALANAGTYNTIAVLSDKITNGEISPASATRALVQLKDLPAPSDKIVKTMMDLCESDACDRSAPCKQVCWLTTGTIMGELCNEDITVQDAVEQKQPNCHNDFKKNFVKKAIEKFNQFELRYEKIAVLKVLGNAGLEPSVYELEKIIRNIREDPLIRMQAIDSLRRLRAVMPQKIQRILMPVYQNIRERPEVRMACLSQLLATIPQHAVIDQIGYTLMRDPSRQVKSFVYMAMKTLSQSPVEAEKELAQHLKALLKLAQITEEDEETLIRGSRYYRIPIYSQAQKEGIFMDLKSIVGSDNVLPKHLSFGINALYNGLFQMNALEVSFTQEDLEQWIEKLLDVYMDNYYGSSSQSKKSPVRGYRTSSGRDSDFSSNNDFRKIVKELGIQQRSVDSDSNSNNNAPFGMFTMRYGDIDYAILPLEEEVLPSCLKKILVQGERPSIRDLESVLDFMRGQPFRVQAATNMLEHGIQIPTSAGFPIRMWHVIPVLASLEGTVKPNLRELTAEIKLHPIVAATHLKRIEVCSPLVNTGVETVQTIIGNLPITGKLNIDNNNNKLVGTKSFKWTIDVPQHQFRVFSLQTLPNTFITEQDWTQQRTPTIKRIQNQQLLQNQQHVEQTLGKHTVGMSLQIDGEVYVPRCRTCYEDIVQALMTTENHLNAFYEPTSDAPRQIVITGEADFFQPAKTEKTSHRQQFKNFYSKSKFDNEMDEYFENEESDERQLTKYLDDFEPRKMYHHQVKLQVETVGGNMEKSAMTEIEADCDPEYRSIKVNFRAQRSPFQYFGESREWTMKTIIQALLPEYVSSVDQYKDRNNDKHQKFVCQIETQWGSGKQQEINLNINGEQARNQIWRQKIDEIEHQDRYDMPKLREQMYRKIAFLNKYDISAEYSNLEPSTKNFLNNWFTALKAWNFWNTNTEVTKSSRTGQMTATVVIDPMTHEHANITIKTPMEIVRIDPMSLPIKVKPFQLVKPTQTKKNFDSFTDHVSSYATENFPECKVDSRNVRTFDDVIFRAPLTKCYSVLAKDCSNTQNPRFAVLLKKTNNEQKALKMLTQGDTIEAQMKNGQLVVKINGEEEKDYENLQNYGIDYSQDMIRINTKDVSVRFNGEKAWVKISQFHKNRQCGLCGHYDDDSEDEWRMSNNELTRDLKAYHKSYSVVDDECKNDLEETHRVEEYKPMEDSFENYERDDEYEQRRSRFNDNDMTEPTEKTEVMEYNHKICFSTKPVKTCPEGSYPHQKVDKKVGFTCYDRSSTEARRMLREARNYGRPVQMQSGLKPSFVETISVPTSCVSN